MGGGAKAELLDRGRKMVGILEALLSASESSESGECAVGLL